MGIFLTYVYDSTYFIGAFFNCGKYKNFGHPPEHQHQIEAATKKKQQTEAATMKPFPCYVYHPVTS